MTSAIVVGGGIAGLFAVRVLSDHFQQVALVERDRPADEPVHRTGVPQGCHVHGLLPRGLDTAEQLFPGITAELRGLGAVDIDMGADVAIRNGFGWSSRFPSEIRTLSMSRGLLEWAVRRRVLGRKGVTLFSGFRVDGLVAREGRVSGVRIGEHEMAADLVVDATGRSSRAPLWLAELGYPPPEEIVVDASVGYATRIYRIPCGHSANWQAVYVQLGPNQTRGGLLTPIEGGWWQVTLVGVADERPPTDDRGFESFAAGLSTPVIADAITGAEPLTGVVGSNSTSNKRRFYERSRRRPEGFVVIGDAVCSFNPIYGQGMTVGALGAGLLGDTTRFQARLGRLVDTPWNMSTGADARFGGLRLGWAERLMARYVDRVVVAGNQDPVVQERFLRVVGLSDPPHSLLWTTIVARVLRPRRAAAECVSSRLTGADRGS